MFNLQPPRHISTLHFRDIARCRMDFRFLGKSGHAADIAAMTEFVQGFGCRPCRRSQVHGARRPKAAKERTRGRWCAERPRARLWGFC